MYGLQFYFNLILAHLHNGPISVAQLNARPIDDQEVAGLTLAKLATFLAHLSTKCSW